MQKRIVLFLIIFFSTVSAGMLSAQTTDTLVVDSGDSDADITMSYTLSIQSEKKNGIAESYNGAIKTIYVSNGQARNRLVSLMRVQSVFYALNNKKETITIVKESGKDKTKTILNSAQWGQYNRKYNNATVELKEDSLIVFGYNCKRAIVKLSDGKEIDVYYAPGPSSHIFGLLEPAFSGIPGLVMRYEYTNDHAVFTYTVTEVSRNIINPKVFKLP
ncbi:MAG: hypothetical protein KA160_00665 [Lacibacter sp.]|nr:hypothetical protein [Lacibacter sp.]